MHTYLIFFMDIFMLSLHIYSYFPFFIKKILCEEILSRINRDCRINFQIQIFLKLNVYINDKHGMHNFFFFSLTC